MLTFVDRGLVAIFAAVFTGIVWAQLVAALVVEAVMLGLDLRYAPWTDDAEDWYSATWRSIAVSILATLILVYAIGDGFAVVGDIILVLLGLVAFGLFVRALNIPRLRAAYAQYNATQHFRAAAVNSDLMVGTLYKTDDFAALDTRVLQAALGTSASPGISVRDGWSYVQQWLFLQRCDKNGALDATLQEQGLMLRIDPLFSIVGAGLGGDIPSCVGALANVQNLILSHMGLRGSLKSLLALPRLQYLNLDANEYDTTPDGLQALSVRLSRLFMRDNAAWKGELPLGVLLMSVRKTTVNIRGNEGVTLPYELTTLDVETIREIDWSVYEFGGMFI